MSSPGQAARINYTGTTRLLGKDVTFYRFPGEGHELTRSGSPVHRVQRAEIVLDWFSEHLAAR